MFDIREFDIMIFKQLMGGSYFGEVDIILQRRRNTYAVAITDCEAFTFPRNQFMKVVNEEYPLIF